MRNLARLFLLASIMFLSNSCFALNEWTLVVYLAGDDNNSASLEESQVKDLGELSNIGSRHGFEIVVQADRSKKLSEFLRQSYSDPDYSGAKRYLVKKDKWEVEEKLGEINTGSPYALWDLLKYVSAKHPAKRYCLIINSHGSGIFSWRGEGKVGSSSPGSVNFDPSRFVAYDDTDDDCLTIFEISAVLLAFRERLNGGRKLDLIGFDACMAGMVEALYQLREGCDVMVANPSLTPGSGFDYEGISAGIARNLNITPDALSEVITKTFIESVSSNRDPQILSSWRTAKAQELTFSLNNLSMELLKAMKQTGRKFRLSNLTSYGSKSMYWDLGRILRALQNSDSNLNGASNAQVVAQMALEAETSMKAARVSMWYDGSYAENKVSGIAIAWPEPEQYRSYRTFYKALDFSKATKWDEVLDLREIDVQE
ncbi:hypothetical protein HYY75_09130 [bacterium]|nr:hypothetical protein [bacterium]